MIEEWYKAEVERRKGETWGGEWGDGRDKDHAKLPARYPRPRSSY